MMNDMTRHTRASFTILFALVLVAAADQVFELPDGTSAAVAASGAIQYHGHRHPYDNAAPPPAPFAEGFSSARLYSIGRAYVREGRLDQARIAFDASLRRGWGPSAEYCARHGGCDVADAIAAATRSHGKKARLLAQFMAEQFAYLLNDPEAAADMEAAMGPADAAALRRYLREQLAGLTALLRRRDAHDVRAADSAVGSFAEALDVLGSARRATYAPPAPRLPGGVLNARLPFTRLEDRFLDEANSG